MEPKRSKSHQLLPDDLVLESVARCGTIGDAVRGAAAAKSLRRRIFDPPFLQHLRGFLNNGGDGDGRPIPTLLLGMYQIGDHRLQPSFIPASDGVTKRAPSLAALPPPPNRDGVCELGPYLPVASRRSLLVLQRRCSTTATEHLIERHGPHPIELSVCNPTTGQRLELPPHHVRNMSHALLDVDLFAPLWSFKLLVAELSIDNPTLNVQIFSTDSEQGHGGWGPVLACPITIRFGERRFMLGSVHGSSRPSPAVVLGDTICWLCHAMRCGDRVLTWRWRGGVACEARIVNPPPGYSFGFSEKCLAALPSPAPANAAGSLMLGMIIKERCDIQVWACEMHYSGSARDWKLWHCIKEVTIQRPMNFSRCAPLRSADLFLLSGDHGGLRLLCFCEQSGTLFLQPRYGRMSSFLFSVDMSSFLGRLDTMEVSKLDARQWVLIGEEFEFFPYEVDLLSHMLMCSRAIRDEAAS